MTLTWSLFYPHKQCFMAESIFSKVVSGFHMISLEDFTPWISASGKFLTLCMSAHLYCLLYMKMTISDLESCSINLVYNMTQINYFIS